MRLKDRSCNNCRYDPAHFERCTNGDCKDKSEWAPKEDRCTECKDESKDCGICAPCTGFKPKEEKTMEQELEEMGACKSAVRAIYLPDIKYEKMPIFELKGGYFQNVTDAEMIYGADAVFSDNNWKIISIDDYEITNMR